MNGISPCPQCHSRSIHIAEWYPDMGGDTEYYCVCDDCGYEDPDRFEEPDVAIDHWNRRVTMGYIDGDDPTDTEYDKLEEDDWEEVIITSSVGAISWGIPDDDDEE